MRFVYLVPTLILSFALCGTAVAVDAVTIDASGNTAFTGAVTVTGQVMAPNVLQGSAGVYVTAAATLTATAFGNWHWISGTTADYTITLPSAASNAGKTIGLRVKDATVASKTYTLTPSPGQNIDGATSIALRSNTTLVVMSDGTGWARIGGSQGGSSFLARYVKTNAANVYSNRNDQLSMVGTGTGSLTIPANTLVAGSVIRLRVTGRIGTSDTLTPPIYTFRVTVPPVVDSFSLFELDPSMLDSYFEAERVFTIRAAGVNGLFVTSGKLLYLKNTPNAIHGNGQSYGGGSSINTTVDNTIGFNVAGNLADAQNTVSIDTLTMEVQ